MARKEGDSHPRATSPRGEFHLALPPQRSRSRDLGLAALDCDDKLVGTASTSFPFDTDTTSTDCTYAWNVTGPGELEQNAVGAAGTMICGLPGMQLFDSLGIDSAGNVVVATLVTGALTVISPAGEVLDQVLTGDPMTTNVCWGGDHLRTAYVTCSATGRLISLPWPRPGLQLNY